MNKIFSKVKLISLSGLSILLFSCYSVFNGGTGGLIVDAESTSTPKRGIANVDIYAYTDSGIRDSDFTHWKEGTVFSPSNSYYGHTTTDADGEFVISNIVWKEKNPDFGKDADYTTIYLLYFHENYGLSKDQTVITSDSTSNTVYAELKAIRKTTALNININDVSTDNAAAQNVLIKITVPQNTDSITESPKIYEGIIRENGVINISYPRWKNEEDKKNGIENTPEISINYLQSSDQITWKACPNADNEQKDYSFLEEDFSIKKVIRNSTYDISLYGKATKIKIPVINGTYGNNSIENDGKIIKMLAKDSDGNFTIDCGEVSTHAQQIGTNGLQTHGNFNNLGNGFFITAESYTEKYKSIDVKFFANGTEAGTKSLRSDVASYDVVL